MSYDVSDLYQRYPELKKIEYSISEAFSILKSSIEKDGTVFVCGNGGSASDAEHIVGELMKGFLLKRGKDNLFTGSAVSVLGEDEGKRISGLLQSGIKAISLNAHLAFTTAYINDVCAEMVYAQQLHVLGRKGDVFIGISSSGNADNVLNTLKVAKVSGIKSILLTGKRGGKCAGFADCCIKVPSEETYKIQEYHLPIYHALCAMLEDYFYGSK
ncbi:MAG: SIS domain-containing protein [Lentisphaerae bacterium]|nr:SIS domain-containing protein [Lentisphaerota bacterium]